MRKKNTPRQVALTRSLRTVLAVWFFAGMPLSIGLSGLFFVAGIPLSPLLDVLSSVVYLLPLLMRQFSSPGEAEKQKLQKVLKCIDQRFVSSTRKATTSSMRSFCW